MNEMDGRCVSLSSKRQVPKPHVMVHLSLIGLLGYDYIISKPWLIHVRRYINFQTPGLTQPVNKVNYPDKHASYLND